MEFEKKYPRKFKSCYNCKKLFFHSTNVYCNDQCRLELEEKVKNGVEQGINAACMADSFGVPMHQIRHFTNKVAEKLSTKRQRIYFYADAYPDLLPDNIAELAQAGKQYTRQLLKYSRISSNQCSRRTKAYV